MFNLDTEVFSGSTKTDIMSFWWLGQAGFAYWFKDIRVLIDPYMSDSLAKKYQGKEFPHVRMMPVPVNPRDLRGLNWVLITHRHTDHMDPETLVPLAEVNPEIKIILPAACNNLALQYGLKKEQLVPVNVGDKITLCEGLNVRAVPSAHEEIEKDDQGNCLYLGYILSYEMFYHHEENNFAIDIESNKKLTFYHSGDCVPFQGLTDLLRNNDIDIAFLPVNGRDTFRRERGVPGNFTFAEAIDTCRMAEIPCLIPHHFGMFYFNTVDRETLNREMASISFDLTCVVPEIGVRYYFK